MVNKIIIGVFCFLSLTGMYSKPVDDRDKIYVECVKYIPDYDNLVVYKREIIFKSLSEYFSSYVPEDYKCRVKPK